MRAEKLPSMFNIAISNAMPILSETIPEAVWWRLREMANNPQEIAGGIVLNTAAPANRAHKTDKA